VTNLSDGSLALMALTISRTNRARLSSFRRTLLIEARRPCEVGV
jgi:hypothetical protein